MSGKRKRVGSGRQEPSKPWNGVELFKEMEGKTSGYLGHIKVTFVRDDRSDEEIGAADRARWQEHRIWEMPLGFSLVPNGRAGTIYFRRGQKLVELDAELAGNPALDIVLSGGDLSKWIDVDTLGSEPVSAEDQSGIRDSLIEWLTKKGLKFSIGGVVIVRR